MKPRIEPLSLDTADGSVRDHLGRLTQLRGTDARLLNVFGTLAHHPALLQHWLDFATYLLTASTLEPRLRELVVLRVGWVCRSPYEWGQHVLVGQNAGVELADLGRLAQRPDAADWPAPERAALRAADQLLERRTLDDEHWNDLDRHFSTQQIMDLVFLVGQYQLVSSALNALRVERDDGLDATELPFPPEA